MNLERIERALRQGPVDEPIYLPGTHGVRRNPRLMLAIAGAVVSAALVVGVGIGIAMSAIRGPGNLGSGVDLTRLAAELEGSWLSPEITADAWTAGLVALGHDRDDVALALENFGAFERARWRLDFVDDHIQIFGSLDGGPFTSMSGGPYELLRDGSIRYDDIGCFMTIPVAVEGNRLRFGPMTTESCDADERLNNDGYFLLVDYERDASR